MDIPQRRLQAGAGGHQPVSRRLEQPDAPNAAAGGSGGHGGHRKICPEAKNLLVIPETTRNTFYLAMWPAERIFHMAGLNVRIGSINPGNQGPPWSPAQRRPDHAGARGAQEGRPRLGLKDFDPCTILLNNDLSAGRAGHSGRHPRAIPAAAAARAGACAARAPLQELRRGFQAVRQTAGHRPWLINPMFSQCGEVNFTEGTGMDVPATNV